MCLFLSFPGHKLFGLSRKRELWHTVEVASEEDGHRAQTEQEYGHPEAHLVHHLANQHPALHFLFGVSEEKKKKKKNKKKKGLRKPQTHCTWIQVGRWGGAGVTHRSNLVLLSFALGDEVAGVHALLDLRRSFGQAFVQVSCAADVYRFLWRGRGDDFSWTDQPQ